MPATFRRLLLCLCLIGISPAWAGDSIEIFQLQGRTPEELIPVIKPLVGDAGLSGMGTRLIVRGTPEQIDQIRTILSQLDKPPRRLMIEVSNDRSLLAQNRSIGVDGTVRINDNVSVSTGRPGEGLTAHARDAHTRRDNSQVQRVQAIEGETAFIATGQSLAVHNPSVTIVGNAVVGQDQVTYKEVRSGFYVVPRLNGDQVTLRIDQRDDRVGPRGAQAIDVQRAQTVVRGRIGEWIELGGVAGSSSTERRDLTRYSSTQRTTDRTLLVRVVSLD